MTVIYRDARRIRSEKTLTYHLFSLLFEFFSVFARNYYSVRNDTIDIFDIFDIKIEKISMVGILILG